MRMRSTEPLYHARQHFAPGTVQASINLPSPINAVVDLGRHCDLISSVVSTSLTALLGSGRAFGCEVLGRGDRQLLAGQPDPEHLLVLVDEGEHRREMRSTLTAQKADADFKFELARPNSATSHSNSVSRVVASFFGPGHLS